MKRESERIEGFSLAWMSSNLTHEGMEKVVTSMKKVSIAQKEKPKTKEDVAKEWMRLASFQQG